MAYRSPAIAAAELAVAQARLELQESVRRLKRELTSPSVLAAAAITGAYLVFSFARRAYVR